MTGNLHSQQNQRREETSSKPILGLPLSEISFASSQQPHASPLPPTRLLLPLTHLLACPSRLSPSPRYRSTSSRRPIKKKPDSVLLSLSSVAIFSLPSYPVDSKKARVQREHKKLDALGLRPELTAAGTIKKAPPKQIQVRPPSLLSLLTPSLVPDSSRLPRLR
jgi:hypothetical protein